MKVKHKVSGKVFTVSDDYFKRHNDKLELLEVVKETKKTKKPTAKKPADKPKDDVEETTTTETEQVDSE